MENILKIESIEKYYGNKSSLTKAINNISLQVEKGEFVAIMGASGSGKTTLLNCISTIDKVTSGNIYVAGRNITNLNGKELNKFRREELGFIFQDFNLLDTLTAYENIALALSIQGVKPDEIDARIREVARELDIESVLKNILTKCQEDRSNVWQVQEPLLLSLNWFWQMSQQGTWLKIIKNVVRKISYLNIKNMATILMVTHDAFTASYASRVIFIKDGRIFNELLREGRNRKEFFDDIMDVVTMLGGELNDAF